jgi:hypothetical protein
MCIGTHNANIVFDGYSKGGDALGRIRLKKKDASAISAFIA